VSLKSLAPPPGSASSASPSESTIFIRISVVRFTKRGGRGHRNKKGLYGRLHFFFIIFLVVQSQCDLGHIFPLKVKQRKDVKKKAMWNVQCIEEWRTSFMTSPPASPVQWLENKSKKKVLLGFIIIISCSSKGKCAESYFLLTAKDFSPEFLFSSAWFCQSWSLPRDLACQTCLQ